MEFSRAMDTGHDMNAVANFVKNFADTAFSTPLKTFDHHFRRICVDERDHQRIITISDLHTPIVPGVSPDTVTITVRRINDQLECHISMQSTSVVHGVRKSFHDVLLSIVYHTIDDECRVDGTPFSSQYLLPFAQNLLDAVRVKAESQYVMDQDDIRQTV
jgi:hypothetical protein